MIRLIFHLQQGLAGERDLEQALRAALVELETLREVALPDPPEAQVIQTARDVEALRAWSGAAQARDLVGVAIRILRMADRLLGRPDGDETARYLTGDALDSLLRAVTLDRSLREDLLAPGEDGSLPSLMADTMAHMTYIEVEEASRKGTPVLIPTGVIEEHGPHLPLAVDIYAAHLLCRMVKDRLAKRGLRALIAPPFYWGVNVATGAFGGSFTIHPETAQALLRDIIESLNKDGLETVFVIDHHGDIHHLRAILAAIEEVRARGMSGVYWVSQRRFLERLGRSGDEPYWVLYEPKRAPPPGAVLGVHAHAPETALMTHYFPSLVDQRALEELEPTNLTTKDLDRWRQGGQVAREITPLGYFGDPHPRDPNLWLVYEATSDAMAEAVLGCLKRSGYPVRSVASAEEETRTPPSR